MPTTQITDDTLNDDGSKATLVTKDGLENLKEELEYLKNTKRKEVADRIKKRFLMVIFQKTLSTKKLKMSRRLLKEEFWSLKTRSNMQKLFPKIKRQKQCRSVVKFI